MIIPTLQMKKLERVLWFSLGKIVKKHTDWDRSLRSLATDLTCQPLLSIVFLKNFDRNGN